MRITVHNAATGNCEYDGFNEREARQAARNAGSYVLHFHAFAMPKASLCTRYERWAWGDLLKSADISDDTVPAWAVVPRPDFDDEPTQVFARRCHNTMFDFSDVLISDVKG